MQVLFFTYIDPCAYMKKFKFLKNNKKVLWSLAVMAVLVIAGFFVFGGNSKKTNDVQVVHPGEFIQQVSVSGKVVAAQDVDMTFDETGKVSSVFVKVGDTVQVGQPLVALDIGTLMSDLESARANYALKRAQTNNSENNVEKVEREQDTLVASAYRKLLSDDLAVVPNNSNYGVESPTVSGIYNGQEGEYKIIIRRNIQRATHNIELRTYGLEQTGPAEVLENEPTSIGTHGLYLNFPDNIESYADTIWYITIPNTKSTSYLANYNAYQEALRTRDRAIADARESLNQNQDNFSVSQAELRVAEADMRRIEIEIAKRTIRAPFTGIVTSLDAKVGSIISPSDVAVSMISPGVLEIESFIPEINIPYVELGDPAIVTLDAYGEEVHFPATVISIDPAETVRDSVSTYRIKLQFNEQDTRVRSGMTANIVITTEEKSNVITVPQGIVFNNNGKKFVRVKTGETVTDREVTVGSISSLGQIQILSGLSDGDIVVLTSETE